MRFENWPALMANAILERYNTPFQWGENDCALFAADVILAMTGIDYAEPFRGQYSDEDGAMQAVSDSGFSSFVGFVNDQFGEMIDKNFLKRGDLALFDTGNGPTLGICCGVEIVAPGKLGVESVSMTFCCGGWRV